MLGFPESRLVSLHGIMELGELSAGSALAMILGRIDRPFRIGSAVFSIVFMQAF